MRLETFYMRFNQLFLGGLLFLFFACSSDKTKENQKELLTGQWNLVEGIRNGKITESLEGTYFIFSPEKMSTNLPIRGAMDSPYTLEENAIIQTIVNDVKVRYAIHELTAANLKISTQLRGYDFVFTLEKTAISEHPNPQSPAINHE